MYTTYWATDDDDDDDSQDEDISKYRNPSPPPGHIEKLLNTGTENVENTLNNYRSFLESYRLKANLKTKKIIKTHSLRKKSSRSSHRKKSDKKKTRSKVFKSKRDKHFEHLDEAKPNKKKKSCSRSPFRSPREQMEERVFKEELSKTSLSVGEGLSTQCAEPKVKSFQTESGSNIHASASKFSRYKNNLIVVPLAEDDSSRVPSVLKTIQTSQASVSGLKREQRLLYRTKSDYHIRIAYQKVPKPEHNQSNGFSVKRKISRMKPVETKKRKVNFYESNRKIRLERAMKTKSNGQLRRVVKKEPQLNRKQQSNSSRESEEMVMEKSEQKDGQKHQLSTSSGEWRPITNSKAVKLKVNSMLSQSAVTELDRNSQMSSKVQLQKTIDDKELISKPKKFSIKIKKELVPSTIDEVCGQIDFPCVGLDHVYEIQRSSSFHDVVYNCAMCHAKCGKKTILQHLKSFKHYLRCLKKYRRLIYQNLKSEKKSKIDATVKECIRELEKDIGRGTMTVKPKYNQPSLSMSDISSDDSGRFSPSSSRSINLGNSSRTNHFPIVKHARGSTNSTPERPDRSMGDFYCHVCDSHMSTLPIWESHVVGKRHRKNLKKAPGEKPSKVKTVVQRGLKPLLTKSLEDVTDAIVGLDFISEIRKNEESETLVRYACYLCSGSYTKLTVIDHLLTTRHRMNYLKEVKPAEYDLALELPLSRDSFDDFICNKSIEMEHQFGRGSIEVRAEILPD